MKKTDTSLGLALSKTLFAHDARLLECDLEASAKAASEVSNLLGCLMATILARDPDNFEKAFGIVVENVRKAAVRTAGKAANAMPDLTSH